MTDQMKITGDYFVIVKQHYERDVRTNSGAPYDVHDVCPADDIDHASRIAGAQSLLPGDRKVYIAQALVQVQPQFVMTNLVEPVPAEPVQGPVQEPTPVDPGPMMDEEDQAELDEEEEEMIRRAEMRREDEEEDRRASMDDR